MKIYTREGDKGITSLWGGEKVGKNHVRVEAYGTIDEANSVLGMARNLIGDPEIKEIIYRVQKTLVALAAEMAATETTKRSIKEKIDQEKIQVLEQLIDEMSIEIPPQKGFAIPGDSEDGAHLDFARTVVRRAERLAVGLLDQQLVSEDIVAYLNRLSDLLFILARRADHKELIQTVRRQVVKELCSRNYSEEETSLLTITLERARQIVDEARKAAEKIGVAAAISVVDAGGNLVIFERMDGALLASINVATDKAYTAVSLRMPTHELAEKTAPGGEFYGLQETHGGRFIIFGGGLPLIENGQLIGGVGVSGANVEEDILVAQAGLKVFQKLF